MKTRTFATTGLTALMFLSNAAIALRAEHAGATAQHAMVATAQHEATKAGVAVLRAGGNAVDAAVAVGYALAVTDPCCGNIGGGGFMVIRLHDGRERFIDFRERAPLRATRTMYLDASGNVRPLASTKGWLAVAVPGTVAGLGDGAPRVRHDVTRGVDRARDRAGARRLRLHARRLLLFAARTSKARSSRSRNRERVFDSRSSRRRSRSSRKTARRVLSRTDRARGRCRKRANGGIFTMDDFASYRVEEAAPLHCRYQRLRDHLAPRRQAPAA